MCFFHFILRICEENNEKRIDTVIKSRNINRHIISPTKKRPHIYLMVSLFHISIT